MSSLVAGLQRLVIIDGDLEEDVLTAVDVAA